MRVMPTDAPSIMARPTAVCGFMLLAVVSSLTAGNYSQRSVILTGFSNDVTTVQIVVPKRLSWLNMG